MPREINIVREEIVRSLYRNVVEAEEEHDIVEYWSRMKRICEALEDELNRRYSRIFRREVEAGIDRLEFHVGYILSDPSLSPQEVRSRINMMAYFIAMDMLATKGDPFFWTNQIGYCDPELPYDPPFF